MNSYAAVCRLREVMRRQHMAFKTESHYVYWLKRYCNAVQRMPPALTSEKKVERFLTDLATINNVAASTQNQAFNALLFFYQQVLEQPLQSVDALRASRPAHLRHAPTVAEIRALLPIVPDLAGYPTNLVARKYPEYQFSWSWAWLFPAKSTCFDRRTNQTVRFRIQESFVQRAIKQARNKLGIQVLPHELRHGYATHCMESGVSPRAIQQVMGHKSTDG